MLYLLTSFNLSDGTTFEEFEHKLDELGRFLTNHDLLDESGPVLSRCRHPVMDTDAERDHAFAFVMVFRDRDQCECAVQYMYRDDGPGAQSHQSLHSMIENPIFSVWEDRNSSGG